MKNLLIIVLLMMSILTFGQKKVKADFVKTFSTDKGTLFLSKTVKVLNGKDQEVSVSFSASVPTETWNDLVKKRGAGNESSYFTQIAKTISNKARTSLGENEISFEPLPKQIVVFQNRTFNCDFKMMARNVLGNMTEVIAIVRYNPNNLYDF